MVRPSGGRRSDASGPERRKGCPIRVEGRLWGVMVVAFTREELLPADTEARLAGFTELAATAIANAQARTELRGFAEEQAALRRVATLVARAAPPEKVFTAVPEEVGRLLKVDYTMVSRYDADGLVTEVGGWARTDPGRGLAIGLRLEPEGRNIHALVFQTGQPTRIDDYGTASGAFADVARDWQYRSSVGVPISVESRLWGVLAGEASPLRDLLRASPPLAARFPAVIDFPGYTAGQLAAVFATLAGEAGFTLTPDAVSKAATVLAQAEGDHGASNARLAVRLLDQATASQAPPGHSRRPDAGSGHVEHDPRGGHPQAHPSRRPARRRPMARPVPIAAMPGRGGGTSRQRMP